MTAAKPRRRTAAKPHWPPIVETVLPEVHVENVDGPCACEAQMQPHDALPDACPVRAAIFDADFLRQLLRREAMKFEAVMAAEGVATRAESDPLTLLEPDEVVLGTAIRDDGVLSVVTSYGRKIGIAPDGWFSVTTGPEFPYALAQEPEAEPEHPAGDADA